jgi:hypothetical protein
MNMEFDYGFYWGLLDEVESELLRAIAARIGPTDQSQLGAVLFLLVRAGSLLRSSLSILETGRLDAFDTVRRAYFEAWALAFEFRLNSSQTRVNGWHTRGTKHKYGIPEIKTVVKYMKAQGIDAAFLGRDYNGLSEVAHPTKAAAQNSLSIVAGLRDTSTVAGISLVEARAAFEREQPKVMYFFLWLLIEKRMGMVDIGVNLDNLPKALSFVKEYSALGT